MLWRRRVGRIVCGWGWRLGGAWLRWRGGYSGVVRGSMDWRVVSSPLLFLSPFVSFVVPCVV